MPSTSTIYHEFELMAGKCTSCGEETTEILVSDGRCVDCIEAQKFEDMTMEGLE